MSLYVSFEPHSWYRGFAIKRTPTSAKVVGIRNRWYGVTENGITGYLVELEADTLQGLKKKISEWLVHV